MSAMTPVLRTLSAFGIPVLILIAGVVGIFATRGLNQAIIVAVLAILEISLSFDNAVINATILRRMSKFWQRIFLTVGMVIAVFGMRLVFPIGIVSITAGLGFGKVFDLVLHHPAEYAEKLHMAHPAIAAFGGMFLLMIFLDFLLNEAKKIHWIEMIEEPLARAGRLKTLSTLLALLALLVVSSTWAGEDGSRVLLAGVIGQVTYLLVRGLSQLFEEMGGVKAEDDDKPAGPGGLMPVVGRAAFFLFVYLEILDASFSFDGVVGAFAVTTDVLTITLGLGIGAIFVRELTVWLVRHNTLKEFVYLEHGAHYAVGALAVLMAASLAYEVPEAVTGLIGAGFIVIALVSSLLQRRRKRRAALA